MGGQFSCVLPFSQLCRPSVFLHFASYSSPAVSVIAFVYPKWPTRRSTLVLRLLASPLPSIFTSSDRLSSPHFSSRCNSATCLPQLAALHAVYE